MSHTHHFPTSKERKPQAGFIDEILKMSVMAVISVITAEALCEYVLKPLWHIIKIKM